MAIYEKRGFCPKKYLSRYESWYPDKVGRYWKDAKCILENRIDYMVYSPEGTDKEGALIAEALISAKGKLGIEVAKILRIMMPKCASHKIGRPIVITDHCHDRNELSNFIIKLNTSDNWSDWREEEDTLIAFILSSKGLIMCTIQDKDFMITIENDENEVKMHVYKK